MTEAKYTYITGRELSPFMQRRALPWIRDAIMDWIIIVGSFASIHMYPSVFTIILAALVIGNRQHALALLGHDGTHFTISYNRKFNDFLTNYLTWLPLGLTLSGYRNLHGFHHKHLGSKDDPEVVYKGLRGNQWDLPARPSKVARLAFLDLFFGAIKDYYMIIEYSKPEAKKHYVPLIAMHSIFIVAMIALGLWWVAALWYYCLFTVFIMFFRLRLWLEHQGTDHAHRLHLNPVQGALFAPHLSWHHWEHHHWPSVPYANLPALRQHVITAEPVMNLRELIQFYRNMAVIPSGTAMR